MNDQVRHKKAPLRRGLHRSQVHTRCTARNGIGRFWASHAGTNRHRTDYASSSAIDPHRTLQPRATLAIVSAKRRLVTAAQLDVMSPNERAAVLAEHIVTDLDELPEEVRDRVVVTGRRLATERDQAATG